MLFSIIVPVYNVENYLLECMESLLNQSYKDFEIILVNDGSTDKSGELCKEIANRDRRIRYYNKKNSGLSATRNFGIEKAEGEYIVFVDSDDWIIEDALLLFSRIIHTEHPEVIITRLIEAYPDDQIELDTELSTFFDNGITRNRVVEWQAKYSQSTWPAVKTIVSKEFIKKNEIQFLEGRIYEDIDWTSNIMYKANIYGVCFTPWYFHRMQRKGSITEAVKTKSLIDAIEIASIHYNKRTDGNYINNIVFNRIMISVYAKLMQVYKCPSSEIGLIAETMRENAQIFKIQPAVRYKAFILICKIFGYRSGLILLSAYGRALNNN